MEKYSAKSSIFTRYMSAFLMIIFVSFTILTVIISSMTVQAASEQRKDDAQQNVALLKTYVDDIWGNSFPHASFEQFVRKNNTEIATMITILSRRSDETNIFITAPDGRILLSTDGSYVGKRITDGEVLSALTSRTPTVYSQLYSDMGGLLPKKCGMYVTVFNYGESSYDGALVVCYGDGRHDALSQNTIKTVILASLWVMIASFVAVYFISEKIVAPIRQMSVATKRFSEGEFDIKIPVEGSDEIAELATAFNSMADSLANLEYMRSSFLANVAHDLRTPMTSISGFIDGILSGAIPQEQQNYYLGVIGQEIRRLSRLVSNLLDISRMEAGNRKFEKNPFDICETARIILLTFEAKIDAKKLNVEFDAPDDRLYVYSDKDAVYQVLYNLCDNAVKFSKDGGIYRITIKDVGEKVSVSVFDEGIGISKEDLPNVFDRFYKSDKSRGLDRTGVGLGLYIVKTIMDNLGEQITVDSVQGEYCNFTLTLTKYTGKLPSAQEQRIDKKE